MPTNRLYSGPVSDHFDGVRFFNPSGTRPRSGRDVLRWQLREPSAAWPRTYPSPYADTPPARVADGTVRVSFIGHASYLIQGAGVAVLLDPVYSERASPVRFAGPQRLNAPGVDFGALPKIDCVLLTHNHYDHMDMPTLKRLWERDRPRFITALGNDALLRAGIGNDVATAITVTDWGHSTRLTGAVTIDTAPAQHWSARGPFDRCHALWASFIVTIGDRTIFASGDSGLGDGRIFREVGARHPRLDLALLPIGAYEPRWIMRDQHMNPDDAVQALEFCGAARALGHHWGTFQLTNEAIDDPPRALQTALAERAIPPGRFVALQPGAVTIVG